ncbi:MAG: phasin family protein [Methylococcales bacterium]
MTTEFPYTNMSKAYEPIQKLIDLNLQKFQAAVTAQSLATKTFVELADARVKAASEIKDFDALAAFIKEQAEIARDTMEKLISESKSTTDEVVAYGNEVQKILNESLSSMTMEKPIDETKSTTDKVVAYGNETRKILNENLSSMASTEQSVKKPAKKAAE